MESGRAEVYLQKRGGGRAAPKGVPEAKADRAQGLGHRLRKSQAQSLPRHIAPATEAGGKRTLRRSSPTDDAAVSELQVWLAIAAGLFVASGIVCFLLASRPEWIGLVAVPFVASVAATIYVFAFDPNPQAGVFLLIFYFVAGVAGAFGSLAGRALRNRSR